MGVSSCKVRCLPNEGLEVSVGNQGGGGEGEVGDRTGTLASPQPRHNGRTLISKAILKRERGRQREKSIAVVISFVIGSHGLVT